MFVEAHYQVCWRINTLSTPRIKCISGQLVLLAFAISLTACQKSEKPSVTTFASPELAGEGLLQAGKSGNIEALLPIFGTDSKEIISSGDPVQDKATVGLFVAGYGAMHRWRKMPDESEVLLIGPANFAFPIPLRKNAA